MERIAPPHCCSQLPRSAHDGRMKGSRFEAHHRCTGNGSQISCDEYVCNLCSLIYKERLPFQPATLAFFTITLQSILMLSSILIFHLYGLHCSKCSYEKYAFNKVTSVLFFFFCSSYKPYIYYSGLACLWTFSPEVEIHFTQL